MQHVSLVGKALRADEARAGQGGGHVAMRLVHLPPRIIRHPLRPWAKLADQHRQSGIGEVCR